MTLNHDFQQIMNKVRSSLKSIRTKGIHEPRNITQIPIYCLKPQLYLKKQLVLSCYLKVVKMEYWFIANCNEMKQKTKCVKKEIRLQQK